MAKGNYWLVTFMTYKGLVLISALSRVVPFGTAQTYQRHDETVGSPSND
jgi:hypothetical protein